MKNDELLHKFVEGTLTPEELEIFKLRPEYESLNKVYSATENLTVSKVDENAILKNILQKKKSNSKQVASRRVFLSTWMKYGLAASILLLVGWFVLNRGGDDTVQYDLAKAERLEEELPDGSTFVLNAESKLDYDAKTWNSNRQLNLRGEAFFKVKKGSKFKVITPNGSVQVLGTAFNVRSRNSVLEVTCKTGKVAVIATTGKVLKELLPNEIVRVEGNIISDTWKKQNANSNWTTGMIQRKNVSVATVLEELERQFDIDIIANNINVKDITSCHFQNEDLDLALKTALGQFEIEYEIKGKQVILK